jgi:hypothetical protein
MPEVTAPVSFTDSDTAGVVFGTVAAATGPPHLPQNFASSGFDWPQLGQNMMSPSQAFLLDAPRGSARSVPMLIKTHWGSPQGARQSGLPAMAKIAAGYSRI